MARVTVEDCLEKVENRFALVHLVSKRAKQLLRGAPPTLRKVRNKFVVTSLREVAIETVRFDYGDSDPMSEVEESFEGGNSLH